MDILIFINEYIKYEELNDQNIQQAVNLWCENKEQCILKYGHISHWNTSNITNTRELFYDKIDFNEDISNWSVSHVTNMKKNCV